MTEESGVLSMLQEYWHLILAGVAFVVGYTKLNAKADQNKVDNKQTREAMRDMETRINRQRAEDLERIQSTMNEVRTDIKTLLQRH